MTGPRPGARGIGTDGEPAVTDFLTAFALVLVIEGLFLALFPRRLHQIVVMMEQTPAEVLRLGGLIAATLGVLLVWLLRA